MTPRKIPVRGCASQQCALKFGVCAQGKTHFHHFSLSLPMSSFFHFWGPIWSNDFDIDRKTLVLYSVGSNAFDPHKNHIPNIITSIHTDLPLPCLPTGDPIGPDPSVWLSTNHHRSPYLPRRNFRGVSQFQSTCHFNLISQNAHAFWPFTMNDHVKPQLNHD